ncbi:MAG TPA: taurine ABC transporter substrate-binding protein, partial [Halanaerobiales bacterium]|nr:taurine ABC transporter substrate-binding protein [Halanaerobiales bacterium]
MRKNIMKKLLIFVLIAFVAVSLSACGGSEQSDTTSEKTESLPEEIRFGILRVPNDETIAMVEGMFDEYFGEKGIESKFTVFDSGAEANQALASGSIDFAT